MRRSGFALFFLSVATFAAAPALAKEYPIGQAQEKGGMEIGDMDRLPDTTLQNILIVVAVNIPGTGNILPGNFGETILERGRKLPRRLGNYFETACGGVKALYVREEPFKIESINKLGRGRCCLACPPAHLYRCQKA